MELNSVKPVPSVASTIPAGSTAPGYIALYCGFVGLWPSDAVSVAE